METSWNEQIKTDIQSAFDIKQEQIQFQLEPESKSD